MLHRRIIRSLCIVLLFLVISVWIWSYWVSAYIGYINHSNPQVEIGWSWGAIFFFYREHSFVPLGWHAAIAPYSHGPNLGPYWPHAGFWWDFSHSPGPGTRFWLVIPIWFPTLLLALLLIFAWRKTRAQPPAFAFPITPSHST